MTPVARPVLAAAIFLSFLVVPATGSAQAVPCRAACSKEIRQCVVDQARVSLFACKLECWSGPRAEFPGCLRRCAGEFHAYRASCRQQLASCRDICVQAEDRPFSDPGCIGTCGTDLATCIRGSIGDAHDCVMGCTDFPGRLGIDCLYGCAEDSKTEGLECRDDFRGCIADCSAVSTTTLP